MRTTVFILLISIIFPNPKIKSLILPGWGEIGLDKPSRGKTFLYAEAALIISAYSFHKLSNSYESDYMAYAMEHASVNLDNQDYMFALDVGSNDNITDFNSIKRRQRSVLMNLDSDGYVLREYGREVYPEGENYDWDWDSDLNREIFNSMRIKSINYEKYVGFTLAGMILNRIISLIDVMILEKQDDSKISSVIIPKGYDGMELQLYIKF